MAVGALLTLLLFHSVSAAVIKIDFKTASENSRKLPRFWSNSGFSPLQPIEKAEEFFESTDVNLNLEIIGSLPNHAIENVRIHWLLNLLSIG
jgi:L-iduronidase